MKTYLKYRPAPVQFIAFIGLAFSFFVLNAVITNLLFSDINAVILNKNSPITGDLINKFKLTQAVSSIVLFVLPGLFFAYYSSPKALPYVGIQKTVSPVILIAAVVFLLCTQPFISWLGELNSKINFGKMQRMFLELEEVYNKVFQIFLQMKTPADLFINLFVMALLPAIGEELFFRGSLQKAFLRLSGTPWFAIISTSMIFALFHGTFFKIIPIFVLGLLLGIIYHVTRNLWYSILIHFLNNGLAVLSVYYANKSEFLKKLSSDSFTVPFYTAFVSFAIAVGLIYFMKRKSDEVQPEVITDDDNDYIA